MPDDFYTAVIDDIEAATRRFETTVDSFGSYSELGAALGVLIGDVNEAVRDFGSGMGEFLEAQAQRELDSADFGSSFLGEVVEGFLAVSGELAEAATETTAELGGWAGAVAGTIVETAGQTTGHLADAAIAALDGDVDEGVEDLQAAVEAVAHGGIDLAIGAATGLEVAWEAIEGVAEIGWEAGEAVVETVVGAGRDVADAVDSLLDWIEDDAATTTDASRDAVESSSSISREHDSTAFDDSDVSAAFDTGNASSVGFAAALADENEVGVDDSFDHLVDAAEFGHDAHDVSGHDVGWAHG